MADEKQHQALYRRYRPQTPAEVLGQDHVIRALTGAIREGRLHHAFLFCGPRGTGKTSTARILAKMVNCELGPTAEPCGVCSQCVAVREGLHLDVVEIDAASHGGVEDARELREKAPTAPVQGREKVYIIDEAQRLSREAFDALLKVFEEPPPGVRFVLATTEPHKMPATIVGRSQRFDFRRFGLETLTAQLRSIASAEGASLTESAAQAIARQAEGSSRDALSLLDQARVLGGAAIDDDVVRTLLGAPRGEVQHELADAVAIGDAKGVFEIVGRLVQDGQDLRNVTAESLAHFRNLLLVKTAPGPARPRRRARRCVRHAAYPGREVHARASLLACSRYCWRPRTTCDGRPRRGSRSSWRSFARRCPRPTPIRRRSLTRLERLERLANLDPGAVVPTPADVAQVKGPPNPAEDVEPAVPAATTGARDPRVPEADARASRVARERYAGRRRRSPCQARANAAAAGAACRRRCERRRRSAAPVVAVASRSPVGQPRDDPRGDPRVGHGRQLRRRDARAGVPASIGKVGPPGAEQEGRAAGRAR